MLTEIKKRTSHSYSLSFSHTHMHTHIKRTSNTLYCSKQAAGGVYAVRLYPASAPVFSLTGNLSLPTLLALTDPPTPTRMAPSFRPIDSTMGGMLVGNCRDSLQTKRTGSCSSSTSVGSVKSHADVSFHLPSLVCGCENMQKK